MHKKNKGVSTLPTMLLLGGIIIEIAIASAFLAYYFNTINFGARLAAEALEVARAGVDDAIIRIINDKSCPNASCQNYPVTVSNGRTANVTTSYIFPSVSCSPDPSIPPNTQLRIISGGNAGNRNRTIQAALTVDCLNGQVTVNSITEI